MDNTRRFFIKAVASSTLLGGALVGCKSAPLVDMLSSPVRGDDWKMADAIKSSIKVPSFPDKTFNIIDFGANGDNKTNNTVAINNAIKSCNAQGGGQVIIPQGQFITGAIHLLSNVNLHLEEGAILSFSTSPEDYLPAVFTRWEGLEMMGYSPLIYAFEQENIAITGKGILEGNANNTTWWPWKGKHKEAHWELLTDNNGQIIEQKTARDKLMRDAEQHIPVEQRIYADGAYLRPPFIQPYRCNNVLIEGITIKNSPFWLVNPVLCNSVTVCDVTFSSHGPNSDGCDPESCNHVHIKNCVFDTGDDCIAIKSGRNADGRRVNTASQNIVIENCHMKEGHGGVVIGSEISGGVNNVFVQNCTMDSPHLERAIRIKTNSVRGGLIEHIRIRNIEVGTVKNAIVINFYYEEGDAGQFDPIVRDIKIDNLHCKNVLSKALYLNGFARDPIKDITLTNSHFDQVGDESIVNHVTNFTIDNVTLNKQPMSLAKITQ
ncbi:MULTISPECIES: glycoside hydrolase family 28 protein [Pseudoalteromonas]|uniref:Glycoside hydrolase family 28 protein n=2 Tax=Pseudoalteromonas TaxID=53246 RepID=A0ABQ6RM07_9GAMM|nr:MULTISPECIES: glycoside hydrolase family 28 protein [Pseudoalteromonas]AYK02496.1 GH28 [Pseudoalteromonas sp.]KAA1163775.1 glycoside hydrolase family 28 protein [Pseudoalteromonas fuliginea]KAA1168889.1 glycoside hydrolase family 28 protein [Pseudoalteromonas fuliginea]GAA78404.1 glycoside hydrolase, family 77 [Pseudoalteromonas sp. BSi20495]